MSKIGVIINLLARLFLVVKVYFIVICFLGVKLGMMGVVDLGGVG